MAKPANAKTYHKARTERLKDAEILKVQNRYEGGVYLAGYAVECAFKSVIVQVNPWLPAKSKEALPKKQQELWDIVTSHDINSLANRLPEPFRTRVRTEVQTVTSLWVVQMRYHVRSIKRRDCESFFKAVYAILKQVP